MQKVRTLPAFSLYILKKEFMWLKKSKSWIQQTLLSFWLKQLPVGSYHVWSLIPWSCGPPVENVELILRGIDSRHNSESQDNDQPDYDSVASDEDPVQEAKCGDTCNDGRTKVSVFGALFYLNTTFCYSFQIDEILCMFCCRAQSHRICQMDQSQYRNLWRWRVPSLHQKPRYNNFSKWTAI